jgi:hypothetical protein
MENINELLKLAGVAITESQHAKPDYIDIDKDGDKTEPMKKAAQDKKESGEVDEGIFKSNRKSTNWKPGEEPAYRRKDRGEKFSLRDLDIDEPEEEPKKGLGPSPYADYKDADVPAYLRKQQGQNFPAMVKESEQLDECGMGGDSMSPMASMAQEMEKSQGRLNISSNFDSESGRKSLTVTAEGDQAEELGRLLKMSGLMGSGEDKEHPRAVNIVGSMDAGGSQELSNILKNSGLQEAYANEPNPKMMSLDQMLNSGDDLHKKKKSYPKAEDGDNPRAVKKESTVNEALEQRLWAEFQREKAR